MVRRSKRIIIREAQITKMFKLASFFTPFHFIARQTPKNINVKVISPFEKYDYKSPDWKIVLTVDCNECDTQTIAKRWKSEWRPALWKAIREDDSFGPIERPEVDGLVPCGWSD